jgi:hypothetical protein
MKSALLCLPVVLSIGLMTAVQLPDALAVVQDQGRSSPGAASRAQGASSRAALDVYGKLPLSFAQNQGQFDERVKFASNGRGYGLFLTSKQAILQLQTTPASNEATEVSFLHMNLVEANPHVELTGLDEFSGKANYFLGNDRARWRTNVTTYGRVKYRGLYPGIDLLFYGNQGSVEYDFIVAPGASAGAIAVGFDGVTPAVTSDGALSLSVGGHEVRFNKPVVYQNEGRQVSAVRRMIAASYRLHPGGRVTFDIASYDHSRPLIIDPTLTYSTYLGGSNNDGGMGVAVDSSGNAYITGGTVSSDFPTTTGALQTTFGGEKTGCHGVPNFVCGDAFVTEINSAGTTLVYSTYLGGSDRDSGSGIVVDSSGNAYVAGETQSSNFPVTWGVLQPALAGTRNAFIAKLNSTGSALLYSTYLGGSQKDGAFAIAANSSGNVYITGAAKSSNFPITTGAFQATCSSCASGIPDAFVAELNSGATALVYSTYLGGSNQDAGTSIALDSSGNAYVTGATISTDFPVASALQSSFGGGGTDCPVINNQIDSHIFVCGDAFVTKINSTGTALIYSTFLGGAGDDTGFGIAVDSAGNAYVGGGTDSRNFPVTAGSAQPSFAGGSSTCSNTGIACGDGFIAKLNAAGSTLIYSTYLGGTADDVVGRIALDSSLNVHYSGFTQSSNFPVSADAAQLTYGGGSSTCAVGLYCGDAIVGVLNLNGSAQVYASYLGGSGDEGAFATGLDSSGKTYVAGATLSTNFPTTSGSFDTTCGTDGNCNGGLSDAFVAKISAPLPGVSFSPTSLSFGGVLIGTTSAGKKITLTNSGAGTLALSSIFTSGDYSQTNTCPFAPSTLAAGANCTITVTFTPSLSGTINGQVTVFDSAANAIQLVSLTGTGNNPLTFSPSTLSFGTVTVGHTSGSKTVTLTNNQTTSQTISFTASANYAATGNGTSPCGSTLAGKANCTIGVTFTPTANGSINGSVTLTSSVPPSPLLVAASGTGSGGGAAPLSFSPANLTFSNQVVGTTSSSKKVTVTNSSTGSVTINSLTAPGEFTAIGSGTSPCPATLAAGKSCTFSVTYSPTVTGTFNIGIAITDSNSVSPQVFNVKGSGILPVTFSPTSLTFSGQSVGTISAGQTVTLTNNQSSTLSINSISASGDYGAIASGSAPCSGTLAANKTCTFTVTFAPTATGTIKGEVSVGTSALGSPQNINITGTAQ